MKNKNLRYTIPFLVFFILSCNFLQGESVPAPSDENVQQIIPNPKYELDTRLIYEASGYSFQPIKGYNVIPIDMQDGAQMVILHDIEKNFHFYFYGTKSDNRFANAEDIVTFWMPAIAENDPNGAINPVSHYPVVVGDIEGIATNVTGQLLDKPLTGQVISFMVSENHYLFVLGFSDVEKHSDLWATEGQEILETLISTVEFLK